MPHKAKLETFGSKFLQIDGYSQNLIGLCTGLCAALFTASMDDSLRQQILAASSPDSQSFEQEFKLPFGDALVDASVCCGPRARPLSGVFGQPTFYPEGSYLQLPSEVNTKETATEFIKSNLPGCQLAQSGGTKKSGPRAMYWTLACKCHRVAKPLNSADFEEGCVSRKGTLKESVKRSDYDHLRGCIVEATEAKKKRIKKKEKSERSSGH